MATLVRRLTAFVLLAGLLVSLTGCLLVGDVTEAWAGARPDARLIGGWVQTEPKDKDTAWHWLSFGLTEEGDSQQMIAYSSGGHHGGPEKRSMRARTVKMGGKRYLLFRAKNKPYVYQPQGCMIRYELDDGVLTFREIKRKVQIHAIRAGDVAGKVEQIPSSMGTAPLPSLKVLDKPTLAWIKHIAEDDSAWMVRARMKPEPNLKQAIQRATPKGGEESQSKARRSRVASE